MTGAELRAIRQEVGWTRERLAWYLDVSPLHVARLERGTRRLTEQTARRMRRLHILYQFASTVGLLARSG
jgi:transcriptional regulator with XRE-family HTH domain